MKCERCGVELDEGQKMCRNCGLRIAEAREQRASTAGIQLRRPPLPWEQAPGVRLPEPPEKMLCSRCQRWFERDSMEVHKGDLYCSECACRLIEPTADKADSLKLSEDSEDRRPRGKAQMVLYALAAVLLGISVFCGYVVIEKGRRLVRGRKGLSTQPRDLDVTGEQEKTPVAASIDPISIPFMPGDGNLACPVCGRDVGPGTDAAELECPRCKRALRFLPFKGFPVVKYVGKDEEKAILEMGGKRIDVPLGKEIIEGSGITVSGFTHDGVVLEKVVTLTFRRGRPGVARDETRNIRFTKNIKKFRADEPEVIRMLRGTSSIQCNGRAGRKVYHDEPITIELPDPYPGTYFVECPATDCWKRYQIVVADFPPVRSPISYDQADVECPVCGFRRLRVARGQGETFKCIQCDRTIELYTWAPPRFDFLGWQEDEAVVMFNGRIQRSKIGEEIWPGSGIINAGKISEDGNEFLQVKHSVKIRFTDYRTETPTEKTTLVEVRGRILGKTK